MELEIFSQKAFQGYIFSTEIRCSFRDRNINCVTARVIGTARAREKRVRFLESVPVMLPIAAGESTAFFRCVIPKSAPPSVSFLDCAISYVLQVEVYYSTKKSLRTWDFRVHQSGLCKEFNISEAIIIHNDMIRTDVGDDTAFGMIVRRLRDGFKCGGTTIEEVVEAKSKLIEDAGFYDFMNRTVHKYDAENKGDIFCYISDDGTPVHRRTKKARIGDGRELCLIEYEDTFLKREEIRLFYRANINHSKIFINIRLFVNGKLHKQEEHLVAEFVSSMCTYRSIDADFPENSCFSFSSSLFEISFSYKVVLDGLEFLLPFTMLSPDGRFVLE
jgi:hypothetical protein